MEIKTDHLTRQLDIIPTALLDKQVTIIGVGAVGSFLCLQLAKMGIEQITVYDFDEVSIENMNNQFYRFKDIGRKKVFALQDIVYDFTNIKINVVARKFESTDIKGLKGILFCCLDNMSGRAMIADSLTTQVNFIEQVFDSRMSAEFCSVYSYTTATKDSYVKTLFSDSEAIQEACTAKSTVYTATLVSGLLVKSFKNYLLKEQVFKSLQWDIKKNAPFVSWSH